MLALTTANNCVGKMVRVNDKFEGFCYKLTKGGGLYVALPYTSITFPKAKIDRLDVLDTTDIVVIGRNPDNPTTKILVQTFETKEQFMYFVYQECGRKMPYYTIHNFFKKPVGKEFLCLDSVREKRKALKDIRKYGEALKEGQRKKVAYWGEVEEYTAHD